MLQLYRQYSNQVLLCLDNPYDTSDVSPLARAQIARETAEAELRALSSQIDKANPPLPPTPNAKDVPEISLETAVNAAKRSRIDLQQALTCAEPSSTLAPSGTRCDANTLEALVDAAEKHRSTLSERLAAAQKRKIETAPNAVDASSDAAGVPPNAPTEGTASSPVDRNAAATHWQRNREAQHSFAVQGALHYARAASMPSTATPSPAKGRNPDGKAGAATPSGSGSAGTSVTSALQVSRVSGIIDSTQCRYDPLVIEPVDEEQLQCQSAFFGHVEWRSLTEVIQYLGAVVKDPRRASLARGGNALALVDFSSLGQRALAQEQGVWMEVRHHGKVFGILNPPASAGCPACDHPLEALSLVNELMGTARVSADIEVGQPLRILPR